MLSNGGAYDGLKEELVLIETQLLVPSDDLTGDLGVDLPVIGGLVTLVAQNVA